MPVPCEEIVKQELPIFRSLLAKELIKKHNFTQKEVAKKLQTTQPAISQYLSLKRGLTDSAKLNSISKLKINARQVAAEIAADKDSNIDTTQIFCKLCSELNENKVKKCYRMI
ncbi:MAG: helix-turn-helix domain-containing protein [Candidatus Bathyarchaeia archaeon]